MISRVAESAGKKIANPRNNYMRWARHPVLSNANHGSHLPAAWRTLYELTQLPTAVLETAIKDGRRPPAKLAPNAK